MKTGTAIRLSTDSEDIEGNTIWILELTIV